MSRHILAIAIIATIFGISATKNTYLDLEKLLNEIQSQDTSGRDLKYVQMLNTPRHHNHRYKMHHEPSRPNLMNIQTMNLFMKPKKHNIGDFLRMDSDRCDLTGRCGCTGTRCGDNRDRADDVSDEVSEIINEINKQIARDDLRSSESNDVADKEDINDLRCDGDRCGYDRYSDSYEDKQDSNRDDRIDIVVLDTQNLEDREKTELQDIANYLHVDEKKGSQKPNILDQKGSSVVDSNAPTPDEFVSHYEIVRNDVIKQILNYIQNNVPIPLKHLHEMQKQLLKSLKMNYKLGRVSEEDLKSQIVEIVFGKKSGTRIYPHLENNDNIYVPRWHYNSLLQYKKDLRKSKSKSVLPLTSQQRQRLLKKKIKSMPKSSWRRSLNDNVKQYGVPFELDIHGLGQFNS
ncbi:unnamed protein product [Euphydryas editha]|uniref:Uncharacterized protein n=1 Tax=Euphydryas editha TaxID=104508 RepID=A0AAU9UE04_EUPED|nr:unnamed protein product [Euphydryas editha]